MIGHANPELAPGSGDDALVDPRAAALTGEAERLALRLRTSQELKEALNPGPPER
jgi:hypothetical protein